MRSSIKRAASAVSGSSTPRSEEEGKNPWTIALTVAAVVALLVFVYFKFLRS